MEIKCFKCRKGYRPNQANTKIYGVYMETVCPFCIHKWEGKLLNFAEEQVGGFRPLNHRDAIKMQKFAQFVELNSSEYYKKRKKKYAK